MLSKILRLEEGFSEAPYHCSEGYPTIGIGTRIGTKGAPLEQYCFTINETVAVDLLYQVTDANRKRLNCFDWFRELNPARQSIIESMVYQLGMGGLFKFKKMLKALEDKDYVEAANQALDSKWARQTPKRAKRHASVLQTGTFSPIY